MRLATTALLLVCTLLTSQHLAAASRNTEPAVTGPTLEQMRESAIEFDRARAAGDAIGMARAAAKRRVFDDVSIRATDLGSGFEFLSSQSMLAEARAAAIGDEAALRTIAEIDVRERSLPSILRESNSAACPQGSRASAACRDRPSMKLESLPSTPVADHPAGRVLTIPAGSDLLLSATVGSKRTLFVYVESKAGADVRLSITDADSLEQVCVDAQAHGFLLCRWQPNRFAQGVVRLWNGGSTPVKVLLIAHQT